MAGDLDVLMWDPALPNPNGGQNWWNHGCPDGYFAQFIAKDQGGYDYGNPITNVRCRAIATTTPETIVDESGTSFDEAIGLFNDALGQTLGGVSSSILGGFGASLPWVLLAVAAYFMVTKGESTRVYVSAARSGVKAYKRGVSRKRKR